MKKKIYLCGLALVVFCAAGCKLFTATARFVAVGTGGEVCWSADGACWNCTAAAENDLNAVACGPDSCMAVDCYGYAYLSTDGKHWSQELISASRNFRDITYGQGLFVAVAADGAAFYYDTAWHQSQLTAYNLVRIAYGGGRFVATSNLGLQYSDNPAQDSSWQYLQFLIYPDLSGPAAYPFNGLAYGNGSFVLGSADGSVYSAPDNFTQSSDFTATHDVAVTFPVLTHGAYNGSDVFIIAGVATIQRSLDGGQTWQDVTPAGFSAQIGGGSFGDGQFILAGFDGKLYRSTDGGATWQTARLLGHHRGNQMDGVAYRGE